MTEQTVDDVLTDAAERHPDRIALRDPALDETVTFGELDERARRVAAGLADLGLEPGEHLSALLSDSIELLELFFASAHAGLVFNPLSYRMAPRRLEYVLDNAESEALVVDAECYETVAATATGSLPEHVLGIDVEGDRIGGTYETLVDGAARSASDSNSPGPDLAVNESDPALLLYTSGTTGDPKGVLHSHRNVVAAALVSLPYNRLRPTDVNVALGPLYHVGPLLCNVLPALNVGACNVIQHGFDPTTMLDRIESEGITTMWAVPTHIRALVDDPTVSDRDIEHVRMIQYSGSAMPAAVARRAREHVPGCDFVNAYGTTEIVFGTLLYPEFHDDNLGSIGRAAPNARVRVVDPDDPVPEATVEDGTVGELLVRASTCMTEYWRNPEATENAIVDGWYRTGDLGYRDEEGFLYFVDRKDDMIVSGGENVYPAEVEDLLHEHPDVAAAAVVGIPDEQWGEVVTAFVVPDESAGEELEADDLDESFLDSDAIEPFKRPRRYHFRDTLPKTGSGKIDRKELQESVGE